MRTVPMSGSQHPIPFDVQDQRIPCAAGSRKRCVQAPVIFFLFSSIGRFIVNNTPQ